MPSKILIFPLHDASFPLEQGKLHRASQNLEKEF